MSASRPDRGPLHAEVGHAGAPVLDRRVPDARAVPDDDLGDRVRERVRQVGRRVAVDERHRRVRAHDDQGMREHGGVVRVQIRQRLQRQLDLHAVGDVQERPAGAERAVHGQELRAIGRHQRVEVALDQVGMGRRGRVEVGEHDALACERRIEVREHGVGVVLDLAGRTGRRSRRPRPARHPARRRGSRRGLQACTARSPERTLTGRCTATPRSPARAPASPRTRAARAAASPR